MSARAQKRLRVALLLETDGPGGAENMVFQMAEELRTRGHEVVAVGPEDGSGWLSGRLGKAGVTREPIRVRRMIDARLLAELASIVRRHRIDVIHSHEFTLGVYGAGAAAVTGRPHVLTMHGGRYYAGKGRRRMALRWAGRRSHAFVGVSSSTRSDLVRDLDLSEDEVTCIPNGVGVREGCGGRIREELDLPRDTPLLLAVGNLYPVKGHRALVRALSILKERRPDLKWNAAVAGRGKEEEPLRDMIHRADLSERVHLMGLRDDIPDLLDAASIFVHPSLDEGLPLAILEAMLSGTPVVASRVGGIPDVVEDGTTGLLVPPDEAEALAGRIERLLDDPGLGRDLAEEARSRVRGSHTVDVMVDRYESIYREAVNGGGTR